MDGKADRVHRKERRLEEWMKLTMRWIAGLVLLGVMLVGLAASGRAQAVTPVPQLDLNKFLGQWYEIVRLPDKPQKKCAANAFRLYAASSKAGRFSEVRSCLVTPGDNNIDNADGRQDKSGDGKLGVKHLVLFHQKRWILAIAPDYSWALMGDPKRKTLWVLARAQTLDAATLADIESKAAAQGFDVSKLVPVKQDVRLPGGRVLSSVGQ